jgi:hypothetical protein
VHAALAGWTRFEMAKLVTKVADIVRRQARVEGAGLAIKRRRTGWLHTGERFAGALPDDRQIAVGALREAVLPALLAFRP